ncbi:MAG TPA: class I SAM-dependent methyltransferase [Nannocystis exedens]|nr:class I SAM-dependent methyltransferase [Nannocystis exedens]
MQNLVALQRCPLCARDAARASVLYDVGLAGVGIVRCEACGLVFATAGARAEDLGADYNARAARDRSAGLEAAGGVRSGCGRKRVRLALYDRLSRQKIAGPRAGARALDIGCNTGLLLDVLREFGYQTEGIERSPAAADAVAAGHRVHRIDIEGAEDLEGRFDLIMLTHVLEHLRRPVDALRWIGRHLTPEGIAVIEVPNFDDCARPLWGLSYRALELGDHLSFFDRQTLSRAIDRAELTLCDLWSAPQAGSLVMPSLLSGIDCGLGMVRSLRGRASVEAAAGGGRLRGGGRLGRLTERVLAVLDRVDPALEGIFGGDCAWGANLVAIVGPGLSA